MKPFAYPIACFIAALLWSNACAQDADDAKKLQGTWEITELIVGGKEVAEKEIKGLRFVFAKDKLMIQPAEAGRGEVGKRTFSFTLDASAKPARVMLTALDGELKGAVSTGIYEIKDDTLRWCQSDDPTPKDRPTEFKSPEGSAYYLFSFRRAK